MIVRIATEGQYEVGEADVARLRELDRTAIEASESGDSARFHDAFAELLAFVRSVGTKLAADELTASEIILPPPDVSFEEAGAEFTGEGLLPNV